MRELSRLLFVAFVGSAAACASARVDDQQPDASNPGAAAAQFRSTQSTVRITSRSNEIAAFVPAVELRIEGEGECVRHDDLPMPGLPQGAFMLQLHYSNRMTSHTIVSVTLDESGHLLRYGEIRGVPRSTNPDFEAARVEIDAVQSTHVTADLAKNEAFAVNTGGGLANQGVRGPVRELEHTGLLAGFRDRADMVIARCMGG